MIYVKLNALQSVITNENLYRISILIKTNCIGPVFIYLGYPYDKINRTTFIQLCIICSKGFIVSCGNGERQWCLNYLTQLMVLRNSLFNVYIKTHKFVNFIDFNQNDSKLNNLLNSLDYCFNSIALSDAYRVFNNSFKI